MKQQVDETTSWWNNELMKQQQVDETTSWWNNKVTKLQVDETEVDGMADWSNS